MTMTLYDMHASGHCHRVRLFLSILQLPYEKIAVSTRPGSRLPEGYRELNPLGQVPTLVDGDTVINDSAAALIYLAKKMNRTDWLPEDPAGAAVVQRWLSTAAGELYRGPVSCRAAILFGRDVHLPTARAWALRLFEYLQVALEGRAWLAAPRATIADLAMYSYLRVANEGDLDIGPYAAIEQWLARVEQLDNFEAMPRSV